MFLLFIFSVPPLLTSPISLVFLSWANSLSHPSSFAVGFYPLISLFRIEDEVTRTSFFVFRWDRRESITAFSFFLDLVIMWTWMSCGTSHILGSCFHLHFWVARFGRPLQFFCQPDSSTTNASWFLMWISYEPYHYGTMTGDQMMDCSSYNLSGKRNSFLIFFGISLFSDLIESKFGKRSIFFFSDSLASKILLAWHTNWLYC